MSKTKKTTAPHYELLYIVSNKFTEKEISPIAEKIKKLIEHSGGEITYTEDWGKKKLAYPINHFNHGYYFLVEFDLAGIKLNEVDTEIKHMTEVLRHQIVSRRKRTIEEIDDEKRIIEKQIKRAEEKRAEIESEEQKPQSDKKTTFSKEKVDKKEKVESVVESKEKEVEKPRTKEEVKLNLDKLDEKLDKILDTDDLL